MDASRKTDWRRSMAARIKGLPEEVLKRLQADERFLTAVREGNLQHVRDVMLAHQQAARNELDALQQRQTPRLRWLADHLDPRYYGLELEDLEELVEARELPHASRDELFDLAWFVGDIRKMNNTIARLGALADEAATLLGVEKSDQEPQTQITRQTAFRRGR